MHGQSTTIASQQVFGESRGRKEGPRVNLGTKRNHYAQWNTFIYFSLICLFWTLVPFLVPLQCHFDSKFGSTFFLGSA